MKRIAMGLLLVPLVLAACSGGSDGSSREAGSASIEETASGQSSADTADAEGSTVDSEPSGEPAKAWFTKDTRLCIGNEGNAGFLLMPVSGTKGDSVDSDELGTDVRCFESDNGTVGVSSMVRVLYDDGTAMILSLHNQPFERPDVIACKKAYNSALCSAFPDKEVTWTLSVGDTVMGTAFNHRYRITRNPDSSFIEATVRVLKD